MAESNQIEMSPNYMAFDQYQRYRLASDIITQFCEQAGLGLEGLKVLDLGGVQGFLRTFLSEEVHITTANLEPSTRDAPPSPNDAFVLISPGALPFPDEAFDFGITCDVLEHVPEAEREAFLSELARVSRRAVIVGGPFATEGVKEAEALVDSVYESIFRQPFAWLQEHKELGLPNLESTLSHFKKIFSSQVIFPTSYLPNWVLLMAANTALAHHPRTTALNQQLTDFYASTCYDSDHQQPAYRHMLVGIKQGPELDLSSLHKKSKQSLVNEHTALSLPNIIAIGALRELTAELGTLTLEKARLERQLEQTQEVRAEAESSNRELRRKNRELVNKYDYVAAELRAHSEYIQRIQRALPYRVLSMMKRLLGRSKPT